MSDSKTSTVTPAESSSDPTQTKKSKKSYQISTTAVNRYDQYSIKAAIDEEFVEYLESKKYIENTNWIDIKILITATACALGYLSHFVLKFPKDHLQIGACVLGYAILMTINYFIETRVEKDSFYMIKSHEDSRFSKW